MPTLEQQMLLTACSDCHVKGTSHDGRRTDPMSKFYVGRPVMITKNIDVEHQIANGAICSFKCLKLKNRHQDCNTIKIDGYFMLDVPVFQT